MPGDQVDIGRQRQEEQKNFKNTLEGIRQKNASQAHLLVAAKEKAAKLIAEADNLDKKAEELRHSLEKGKLTSYETLEGALLECVNYLETLNEANSKRYIASWYADHKWGPRLIQAGDFVKICLDPKNIPHAIQAAGENIAEKTGFPKKYYDSKYGVKDKQTPQQLQYDYQYDDGKFKVTIADPFELAPKDGRERIMIQQLEIHENFNRIMDATLNLKGFKQNPDDQKYYKVDGDGNLTDEVITEEQFKDIRDMLVYRNFPKDNQALNKFEEDTGLSFAPGR